MATRTRSQHRLSERFLEAKLPTGSVVFTGGTQLRLEMTGCRRIRHALKSAKVVIALFSPESVERPWVNFEAGGAWFSDTKKLIPVCIGGLIPARLPKPYSNIQGINLQDRESIRDFVKELWDFSRPHNPCGHFKGETRMFAHFTTPSARGVGKEKHELNTSDEQAKILLARSTRKLYSR